MRDQRIIYGVDGGGTTCRAAVCLNDGPPLGFGKAGASNIMTNIDLASHNIVEACNMAAYNAGLESRELGSTYAYLGLAGANIAKLAAQVSNTVPFSQCIVDTDAMVALHGAFEGRDGAAAIIGTGSVFVSRLRNQTRTVGGWGFDVGDLGSGARIGRELLQEALLAHDGVRGMTPITAHVLAEFRNNPQTLVEYAHSASPRDFGKFAPLILEFVLKNDPTANRIWQRAVKSVEETLASIIDNNQTRLCLLGGLGHRYSIFLSHRFTQLLEEPLGTSLDGALSLAHYHFATTTQRQCV